MQSSVGVAFRALVMLGCLALVPLLAIYGKQLPDLYRAVLDAYKARIQHTATEKGTDPLAALGSDAPAWAPTNDRQPNDHQSADRGFHGPNDRRGGDFASTAVSPPVSPPVSPTSYSAGSAVSAQAPAQLPAESPAQSSAAVPPAPWNNSAAAQPLTSADRSTTAPPGRVQPASFATPVDPIGPNNTAAGNTAAGNTAAGNTAAGNIAPGHAVPADPADATAPGGSACTVQFRQVQQRLRELGATYYFLETWGSTGDRYRFYCTVALAGNTDSGHNRIFQATDADPLQAMKNVLDQVELWRSGRE